MAIHFLLLGRFQVRLPDGRIETINDTMAARILAYVAFHRKFCSRDEVVRACWGPEKLSGREPLKDEAYQRQIGNLRRLFTDTFGLVHEDFLRIEDTGLQLHGGCFTSDLTQFNELLTAGQDIERPAAERVLRLREALNIRRGYLLDGMRCHWLVSLTAGARELQEVRWDETRRALAVLEQPPGEAKSRPALVAVYSGVDEWLSILKDMIASATDEIILYGMHFLTAIPALRTILLDRLRAGVHVKILMLDASGTWLPHMALATANDEQTLRAEVTASASGLRDLHKKWEAERSAMRSDEAEVAGTFEIRTFDAMIHGRIYAVDPNQVNGKLLWCGYMYCVSPAQLPCQLWKYGEQTVYSTFVRELYGLWDKFS